MVFQGVSELSEILFFLQKCEFLCLFGLLGKGYSMKKDVHFKVKVWSLCLFWGCRVCGMEKGMHFKAQVWISNDSRAAPPF